MAVQIGLKGLNIFSTRGSAVGRRKKTTTTTTTSAPSSTTTTTSSTTTTTTTQGPTTTSTTTFLPYFTHQIVGYGSNSNCSGPCQPSNPITPVTVYSNSLLGGAPVYGMEFYTDTALTSLYTFNGIPVTANNFKLVWGGIIGGGTNYAIGLNTGFELISWTNCANSACTTTTTTSTTSTTTSTTSTTTSTTSTTSTTTTTTTAAPTTTTTTTGVPSSNQITITEDMVFNTNGEESKNIIRLFDDNLSTKLDNDGNWAAHMYNPFSSFIVLNGTYTNLRIDYYDFSGADNLYLRLYDNNKNLLGTHTIDGGLWDHWRTVPGLTNYTNVRFIEIFANTYFETSASIMEMRIYGDLISSQPSIYPTAVLATPNDEGKYAHGVNSLDYFMDHVDQNGTNIISKVSKSVRIYYEGPRFDYYPNTYTGSLVDAPLWLGRFGTDHLMYWFNRVKALDMKFHFSKTGGSIKWLDEATASLNTSFITGNAANNRYTEIGANPELESSWAGAAEQYYKLIALYGKNTNAVIAPNSVLGGSATAGQDKIDYFELGNEEDRFWVPTYYLTPKAYYLRLRAMYARAKQADPNAKVYAPATTGLKREYWKALYFHHFWLYGKDAPFPADAFCMNFYLNNGLIGNQQSGSFGISAEQGNLYNLLVNLRTLFSNIFPGKALIWTEYGYATDDVSPYHVDAIGSKTDRQVQADWTLRLKAIAQTTNFVEKMYYYAYFQDGTGPFNSMGMHVNVDETYAFYSVFPVAYAIANEIFIENDYNFLATLVTNGGTTSHWVTRKTHKTDNSKILYKLWMGTANGSVTNNVVINAGGTIASATLYNVNYGSYEPTYQSLTPSGATVNIPTVSEGMTWVEITLANPASTTTTTSTTSTTTTTTSTSTTTTTTTVALGDINQSGLVFYVDANKNSSYPGFGSSLTNIAQVSNNVGTISGTSYSSAEGGQLIFDGVNDYVDFPTNWLPYGSSERTVCIWAKVSNETGFRKMFDYGSGGVNNNFAAVQYNGAFWWGADGNESAIYNYFNTNNQWHYLVMTVEGVGPSATKLYINGVYFSENPYRIFDTIAGSVRIGSSIGTPTNFFKGSIGSVHVYDRVLSPAEIASNYNVFSQRINTVGPTTTTTTTVAPTTTTTTTAVQSAATFTARPDLNISATVNGLYEYLPRGYNNPENSTKNYPVLIAFHGIGELGNGNTDLNLLLNVDISQRLNNSIATPSLFPEPFTVGVNSYGMIVICPQYWWNWESNNTLYTNQLIDYVIANYRVDTSRIYLSGLSLGGGLVSTFVGASTANANRIAAAILAAPSGAPPSGYSTNIVNANLPLWFVHSIDDPTVPIQWTTDAWWSEINALSPNFAKRTRLNGYGHNVWSLMYNPSYNIYSEGENQNLGNPATNFYQWLLQFNR